MKASYERYINLKQDALSAWRENPRCVICGNVVGLKSKTREHVPPQGIFVGAIDEEMLTVPCCESCNNGTSEADREFKYSPALFYEKIAKHQTRNGSVLYAALSDKRDRLTSGSLSSNLKKSLDLYFRQPGVYRQNQWWPSSSHDPVIIKAICGLFWLYRGGEIFTDRAYRVIICRDIDFLQSNANKHIGQSYPGIKIGKGQFVAHHIQSFENANSIYAGVFGVSMHFHTRMKLDRGYHILAYCIPVQTTAADSYVSGFMKSIDRLNLRKDKVSSYELEVGGVKTVLC